MPVSMTTLSNFNVQQNVEVKEKISRRKQFNSSDRAGEETNKLLSFNTPQIQRGVKMVEVTPMNLFNCVKQLYQLNLQNH